MKLELPLPTTILAPSTNLCGRYHSAKGRAAFRVLGLSGEEELEEVEGREIELPSGVLVGTGVKERVNGRTGWLVL